MFFVTGIGKYSELVDKYGIGLEPDQSKFKLNAKLLHENDFKQIVLTAFKT